MAGARGTPLRVEVSRRGGTLTVALAGELDLATADGLRRRLVELAAGDPAPQRVVLDLAGLEFLDASGISALLAGSRAVARRGGRLVLRSPSRLVRRVVRVLDLEHVLPVER